MKYFFDTEFIEGFKKPISWLPTIGNFNKPYHSIQLISIGIVAEDGREYYAISNEFDADDANDWVKENVICKLGKRYDYLGDNLDGSPIYGEDKWKSNSQIAIEVIVFIHTCEKNLHLYNDVQQLLLMAAKINPEFYAYYADYDWVVFCSLFGTMMDLPKGFPMYCRDLKQSFDETVIATGFTAEALKQQTDYPKQQNEHNALDDAKWNFKLYQFLQSL